VTCIAQSRNDATALPAAASPLPDTLPRSERPGEAPWPARSTVSAHRMTGGKAVASVENLIEEVPVALVYNGVSHAVMLASPSDLEDFALGFSLSEGILHARGELYNCELVTTPEGIEVRLDIAAARMFGLQARRRSLAGRTGCGLCGVESLQAALRTPAPVPPRKALRAAAIQRVLADFSAWQPLHRATGAAHAAAWASNDGIVQLVREDVGRHNALDKLIGALAKCRIDPASGFAVVTSRASYEMVQKAAAAGIGLLAAISAPTAFAVRVAETANVTLVGLARPGRMTAYSHPDQLTGP